MSELSDFIGEFKKQSDLTNRFLVHYLAEQQRQATQTPIASPPISVNVKCLTDEAFQVLPRNENRYKVGLVNYGPSDILYYTGYFKPLDILGNVSDPTNPTPALPAFNQIVRVGILPAGNNVDINSIQAIWVYNVDSAFGDASNVNALISLQDSLFQGHVDPAALPPNHAATAWKADTLLDHGGSLHMGRVN